MRIEKINENKIKVMIYGQEAEHWYISFKEIDANTPQVQEMFWKAMKLAEENVDFSIDGAKLFVEAVRGEANDGFGMMITRVVNQEELQQAIDHCQYKGTLKKSRVTLRQTGYGKPYIYRFSEFENACAAAGELADRYVGDSVLYKLQSAFYLYLVPQEPETFLCTEMLITEFGEKVKNCQYMHGRLHEYGEVMIPKGAIEIMQEYFAMC